MNINKLETGMRVKASSFENDIVLKIVADDFINSPKNKDIYTCSLSYANQEMSAGRLKIIDNANI
jgi:hypothetical protein